MNVREYIRGSWQKSLREKGHRQDGISLPYPYYSPCAQGLFDEFYYWDTCFINKGLLADGNVEGAMLNALNVAYLIEQYGFMPNAAVRGMLNRSQPPLFCIIVLDLLPYCSRTEEARLLAALEREYGFWMCERRLACGLNHYGNSADRTAKPTPTVKRWVITCLRSANRAGISRHVLSADAGILHRSTAMRCCICTSVRLPKRRRRPPRKRSTGRRRRRAGSGCCSFASTGQN